MRLRKIHLRLKVRHHHDHHVESENTPGVPVVDIHSNPWGLEASNSVDHFSTLRLEKRTSDRSQRLY